MKVPPDLGSNPDATIQLNRADLPSELTLHDPDEEPLPSRERTAPPPLPAYALSHAPAASPTTAPPTSPPPQHASMAPPPPRRSPVLFVAILGAVLVVGFGGAFVALRVLSPKPAVVVPVSPASAPASASGSAAPMITIPTVEMN